MTTSMGAAAADGFLDGIALVEARTRPDLPALWVILDAYNHRDSTALVLALVELCAGVLAETGTDIETWAKLQREWLGTDWEAG